MVKAEVKEKVEAESECSNKDIFILKSRKEVLKDKLKKFAEDETKLVRGRFRCYESPGDKRKIIVKKYPEVPMFEKEMVDGEIYEIPLYVARHLNGVDITADSVGGKIYTCSYPIHGFKWENNAPPACTMNQAGSLVPVSGIVKRERRYGFESMEFGL